MNEITIVGNQKLYGVALSRTDVEASIRFIQQLVQSQTPSVQDGRLAADKLVQLLRNHSLTTVSELEVLARLQFDYGDDAAYQQLFRVAQCLAGPEDGGQNRLGSLTLTFLVTLLLNRRMMGKFLARLRTQDYYDAENPLFDVRLAAALDDFALYIEPVLRPTDFQEAYADMEKARSSLDDEANMMAAGFVAQFSPVARPAELQKIIDLLNQIVAFVDNYASRDLVETFQPFQFPWQLETAQIQTLRQQTKELQNILSMTPEFGEIQRVVNALRHAVLNPELTRVVCGFLCGFYAV